MANETSVLELSTSGAAGRKPTGKVVLVNSSGVDLRTSTASVVAGTTMLYTGACTTRDTVRAEVGTGGAVGSLYLSTAGKIYLKIANAGATADWTKVTATAAD